MCRTSKNTRAGQILILFAIGLVVLIALAALVLDGGQLLLNRRTAQAAADAGALAGAYQLCSGGDETSAITAAQNFAITQNGASTAVVSIVSGEVKVDTTIAQNSYFANIFGVTTLNASATASAGCFTPSKMQVLPIAWSCKAPGVMPSTSPDCTAVSLNWPTEFQPLITGTPNPVNLPNVNGVGTFPVTTPFDFKAAMLPQIYIIMDSGSSINDVSVNCKEWGTGGTMTCDINGDGKIDIIGNGDRSWLDLNGGGGGASSLSNWMQYGYNTPISTHTWLAGQTGVANSVFQSAQSFAENRVNILPIFNQFCTSGPLSAACQSAAHSTMDLATDPIPSGGDTVVWSSGSSTTYFHIVGFGEFYVTCVDAPSADSNCPGHRAAVTAGAFANNTKTIEGYFVRGYMPPGGGGGGGSGGVDMGIYIRSLTH